MRGYLNVPVLITVVLALDASSAHVKADDVQCTVKVEACGALEQNLATLTKIKEGVCMKVDLATIGKKPAGLYYTAVVWVGVSVSGDTLVFGKGEAKSGVALECAWSVAAPKPNEQIESLKRSIPQLLKDERIAKRFPHVKKIDVSGLKAIQRADAKCAEAIAGFCKKK